MAISCTIQFPTGPDKTLLLPERPIEGEKLEIDDQEWTVQKIVVHTMDNPFNGIEEELIGEALALTVVPAGPPGP